MIQFAAPRTALTLLAGLVLIFSGCNPQSGSASSQTAQARAKPEPTESRLTDRSKARWASVSKSDWIAAYDYLTPEQKQQVPLAQFLPGKDLHEYANPQVLKVLKIEGEKGYVLASAVWTPHHPQLSAVKLEPGQTLTQELKMVETWVWVDGDWMYFSAEGDGEFLAKHPDLLKGAPVSKSSALPTGNSATETSTPKH
jgi:hypothetical protein